MRGSRIVRRLSRIAAFLSASRSPAQWPRLALLGWVRDNPSGMAGRWRPEVRVRPAALRGRAITISTRDLGQLMSFEEIFVESVYDLALVPFAPTVVLDCGAHAGYFSALALARYPQARLTAFEPNPDNLDWLRRNLSPDDGRVSVHAAAVSTWDGKGAFTAAESNAGRLVPAQGAANVEVSVMDLAVIVAKDPQAALLIKIDIEGEERRLIPHVLPVLPRRCALFLETHDGPAASDAMTAELTRHGFRVSRLRARDAFADLFAVRNET